MVYFEIAGTSFQKLIEICCSLGANSCCDFFFSSEGFIVHGKCLDEVKGFEISAKKPFIHNYEMTDESFTIKLSVNKLMKLQWHRHDSEIIAVKILKNDKEMRVGGDNFEFIIDFDDIYDGAFKRKYNLKNEYDANISLNCKQMIDFSYFISNCININSDDLVILFKKIFGWKKSDAIIMSITSESDELSLRQDILSDKIHGDFDAHSIIMSPIYLAEITNIISKDPSNETIIEFYTKEDYPLAIFIKDPGFYLKYHIAPKKRVRFLTSKYNRFPIDDNY